ncbi:peptidylprolyl isomerase [Pseudorhodobacter aquimaris]|uniref:peptidylprolyl isomerase n=1 Tax=Pseudorhodobacter aquimaris TaxID=687412 RepID=UPI00067E0373|nr:peptidylprolyl isomerase [Pseudorhodobacter aquimaris]
MMRPAVFAIALSALFLGSAPVQAQNLFAPRIYVNDRAITEFEVQQRIQMLRLFNTSGDLEELATKALVEDRLRMDAAKSLGLKATPEQIAAGMEEFASRVEMSAEQFIAALGQSGVSSQTFRDFVESGLLWREVVRRRYAGKIFVSDAEVEEAIARAGQNSAMRVLISELVIPAPPGQEAAVMARAEQLRARIKTEGGFSAAARGNSAAPTAARGGRLDWMPLKNLPAPLASSILGLAPGEVSPPVPMNGAVALFQLRGLEEIKGLGPQAIEIDYAQYVLSATGGVAAAAKLRSEIDTCDDLYGINKGKPAENLIRETKTASTLPANIGRALADLDPGESVDYPAGAAHMFLMLCARTPVQETPPDADAVRERLLNQRVGVLANSYLEELRFNAIIREP